ncbi:hypothetical protein [Undibacterium squillarum]|uniref:hypothetical protein n=1 Tax=Undibacterium squillarum TaxID=1131567 RepID=UPI0035B11E76
MDVSAYAEQAGLQDIGPAVLEKAQQYLDALKSALATSEEIDIAWQYAVPELGEGGSCSLFGQLASGPYDLLKTLGGDALAARPLLRAVTQITAFYRQHSQSDWFGIYQARQLDAHRALVKLAYFGAPSRAEFPLTPEFAAISNNSSVGLSGRGRIIHDVQAYVAGGGEYYTCDPKVNAEACLPVLANDGSVLGIIDAETFRQNLYQNDELALLLAVCVALSSIL